MRRIKGTYGTMDLTRIQGLSLGGLLLKLAGKAENNEAKSGNDEAKGVPG